VGAGEPLLQRYPIGEEMERNKRREKKKRYFFITDIWVPHTKG